MKFKEDIEIAEAKIQERMKNINSSQQEKIKNIQCQAEKRRLRSQDNAATRNRLKMFAQLQAYKVYQK